MIILVLEKLRHKKVKKYLNIMASKWQNCDFNPGKIIQMGKLW